MNFSILSRPAAGLALVLISCGRSEDKSSATSGAAGSAAPVTAAPATTASVKEAVRHYADLLAQGTRLTTPTSRQFAGVEPSSQPATDVSSAYSVSMRLALPGYVVDAFLDQQQRLAEVSIAAPRPPEDPNRMAKYVPLPPARLVRLGELRQLFGPGTPEPGEAPQEYRFTYHPAAASRTLTISAFVPSAAFADSAMVDHVSLFIRSD
jgi:hypothetical protein